MGRAPARYLSDLQFLEIEPQPGAGTIHQSCKGGGARESDRGSRNTETRVLQGSPERPYRASVAPPSDRAAGQRSGVAEARER